MIYARSRRGVAGVALAGVVLLVVAAGAASGAFYLYHSAQGGPPVPLAAASISSPSSTISTTSSSSVATSVTASAPGVSLDSGTCPLTNSTSSAEDTAFVSAFVSELKSLYTLNYTANELFGNFSQMAFKSNTIINGSSLAGPSVYSYVVIGRPVIDSLRYYQVNFTSNSFGSSINSTVLFAPNGTATSVTAPTIGGPGDSTGSAAAASGASIVSPFLYELQTSAYTKEVAPGPGLGILNETTVSLGPTPVDITYFTLKPLPMTECGSTFTKSVLGVGTAPGTKIPLELYDDAAITSQGTSIEIILDVVSLAVAGS